MNIIYISVGLVIFLIIWIIFIYNRLVKLNLRADEALSDIDVQLKRRFDLIPNLIETVKGYLHHEEKVLTEITQARSEIAKSGGNPVERNSAENTLTNTLKSLFAVAENYPDLKANANFLDLQRELADTENKIQASRRFFNSTIMELNTAITTFPSNLIAHSLGFSKKDFFIVEEEEKENIKVSFKQN